MLHNYDFNGNFNLLGREVNNQTQAMNGVNNSAALSKTAQRT